MTLHLVSYITDDTNWTRQALCTCRWEGPTRNGPLRISTSYADFYAHLTEVHPT